MAFTVANIAGWLVGLFFAGTGVIELIRWRSFAPQFVRWGYPAWWPLVTFALKVIAGVLVFVPATREAGLALCALIAIAAAATVLWRHERDLYGKALPVLALMIVLSGVAIAA